MNKKKGIVIFAISFCVIIIAIVVFFTVFARNPKSTVESFLNAASNGDKNKVISLIDAKGYAVCYKTSFNFNALIYDNKLSQYNMSDFKNRCNTINELDNEENLKENTNNLINALKNVEINDINEEPIEGFDGISLVTVNMKLATKDKADNYKFYTYKKDFEYYIIDFPSFMQW